VRGVGEGGGGGGGGGAALHAQHCAPPSTKPNPKPTQPVLISAPPPSPLGTPPAGGVLLYGGSNDTHKDLIMPSVSNNASRARANTLADTWLYDVGAGAWRRVEVAGQLAPPPLRWHRLAVAGEQVRRGGQDRADGGGAVAVHILWGV